MRCETSKNEVWDLREWGVKPSKVRCEGSKMRCEGYEREVWGLWTWGVNPTNVRCKASKMRCEGSEMRCEASKMSRKWSMRVVRTPDDWLQKARISVFSERERLKRTRGRGTLQLPPRGRRSGSFPGSRPDRSTRGRRRSCWRDGRSGWSSPDDTADRAYRLTFLVSATPR